MLGTDDSADTSLDNFLERVETQLEKNVGQLSKAVLKAALEELRTIGDLKVDEFLVKLKTTSHEVLSTHPTGSAGLVPCLPVDFVPLDIVSRFLRVQALDFKFSLCLVINYAVVGTTTATKHALQYHGNDSQDHVSCYTDREGEKQR